MKKSVPFSLPGRVVLRPVFLSCILFLCESLYAQQYLNLDFETVSAKNPRQPWGWDQLTEAKGMETTLDTTVVFHGKYSLVLKGNQGIAPGLSQSLVFDLEPLSFVGKTLKMEGWIRCENFAGDLVIKFEHDTDMGHGQPATKSDSVHPAIMGSYGWKKFSFTSKLPLNLTGARISIYQSGMGRVWIDDLSILANGQKITHARVAVPFNAKQFGWLDHASASITKVDAAKPGAQIVSRDLAKLKEIAGKARIIALGEATHGTSEFFRMKHRVLEYAVKEMGVRVFAMEDHQLIMENVNKYVLGGPGTARESMTGMFGVWDNQEVYDLIKWIRAYNNSHPQDKVEVTGFDMQAVNQSIDSLYSFLKTHDSVTFIHIRELLSHLKNNWQTVYSANDSLKRVWNINAEKAFDLVEEKKSLFLSGAATWDDSMRIERGLQFARLIKQYTRENLNPMALYRDIAMSENISWLLSVRKAGTKMMVWAHDVHISRGEYPQQELNYHGGISMGSWLAKKYGEQYKAFGISTYTGAYRAYPGYTDYSKWISCPVYPGPVGSIDQALHKIAEKRKTPALLLDLTNAKKQKWLSQPLPVRFSNHVCYEYAYWTRFVIPFQFDGIFFIDSTNPAGKIREE